MTAQFQVQGDIAVIQLENPPVNSLSLGLRQRLSAYLTDVQNRTGIKAAIIIGSDSAFCGGGDIREFGTEASTTTPRLRDLLAQMDSATKPLVAAIGGFAIGGGLELALGCHYRVALPGARLAFPEITLGLVAAGGGIQRLPRIIPLERASAAGGRFLFPFQTNPALLIR